nr:trypsin-like peptidase domain-containing protein [Rubrivivax gelatinosus]
MQDATERICELKGSVIALEAFASAMAAGLTPAFARAAASELSRHAEAARAVLLNAPISEHTLQAFEQDTERHAALLAREAGDTPGIEPLLLATVPVSTFSGTRALSAATGFFFERDGRLHLVTSRHVLLDEPSGHRPDRVEIELHADADNLRTTIVLSLLLYRDGLPQWREVHDAIGLIDVAALPLEAGLVPADAPVSVFSPASLEDAGGTPTVGSALRIVGFPLGFYDTVHRLPVVRQAAVASSWPLPFQGRACFLTDGRTHRGMSGAPVVLARDGDPRALRLLGIHSSRMDMATREDGRDESLGLNATWYASELMRLTGPAATPARSG